MTLQSTEVLPDNTLEEFRIEFNKLITDVSGLSLGNTFDSQIIFEGSTDDTFETGISVTDPTSDRSIIFPDQSGNVLLDSANITLVDNIELQFGTGGDLKIYHDGSHSYIEDAGTGNLKIQGSQVDIIGSGETMATFVDDGAVTLYHNNVAIVATAATGISVTGDVTATDDLILDNDGALIQFGDNQDVTLTHVHDTGLLLNTTMVIQFRDSAINIGSPTDGDLDINADDEIELNSTLVDCNANLDVSGTYTGAGLMTTGGNIVIPNDGTIGSVGDTDAIVISSGGVVTFSATPVFSGDSTFADDVSLLSDAAVLSFGENSEVTLTHVHNDGLLLNADNQLQFRDSAINIRSDADGDLDINADDEIELNSTLIDINGNVEISGTTGQVGVLTTTATQVATGGITSGSDIVSDTDSTDDLGTTGVRWANLFVDGITATDQITATGFTGTLDGILGSGAAAAATTTTLASTTITASGVVSVDDATDTSSGTTGSIHTDGGLGIAKKLFVGTNATVSGTTLMTGVATHGGNVVSDTDSTDDLGTTGVRWANLYVDAITATDQITATGFTGTLDGILGSGTAAAATTTTLASTTITASGIVKTDDTTDATSTTDGSLQTDGGLSVALDAILGNDVKLLSDASVLSFGGNSEVTLTHVHNDGLLLNTDMQLQFRDSAINIRSDADGDLDINADDEIELNSTLIDINGAVDVSGTYTGGGLMTTGGNIVIPDGGNIGTASDTNAMSISSIGILSLTATNAMKLNVGTTAQRPTGAAGLIRYNSTTSGFEGYGAAWGALGGGATGGGTDTVFIENEDDVTADYTITSGSNALCVGPITIAADIDVTIPAGSRWVIL